MAVRHMNGNWHIEQGSPTRLRLLHEAGTVPVKVLNASRAYCSLNKEPQELGKEPFSLLLSRSTYSSCSNQNLVLVIHLQLYILVLR